ncbi:phosphatidylglycerophosphatase [Methylophilus rhizosphaerae]|uniref:Phosphatidylglycerophosphatase A n=1 Tax=Methylophilus rhizosphaerae TaxID=492660 RepID=A0A1G8ZWA4_9PROT|nr:phosphatidylglycerophosphatase A [Methylophilus rhizosphaerae]SDK19419.1 phosphatidylglycerophosphatase [Methylophilus rhizosphaerae]
MTNTRASYPGPDAALLVSHPLHFLSLGLGSGLSPKAPGTAGTLLGFPLFWMLMDLPPWQQGLSLLLLFMLGVWCCGFTGRALGVSDHGAIVWDEIVAMAGVLITVPSTWGWGVAAFALFRLFDIWKPFPIRWADRHIKGGLGVMLDDVLAAIMAIVVLQLFQWWI